MKVNLYTFETAVEMGPVDGYERELIVTYSKHKGRKGSTDGRYGPKLEPDEPAGIEIEYIKDKHTGEEITVSNKIESRIEESILDSLDDESYQE